MRNASIIATRGATLVPVSGPDGEDAMIGDPDELDHRALLAGQIDDAWDRCLPLWRPRGRVEDLPRNVRAMMYWASPEKLLGMAFAAEFRHRYEFLVGKLTSPDPVESACAHDLLVYIFREWSEGPDPVEAVPNPIPGWVREELGHPFYKQFRGGTLGELFRFERDGPQREEEAE
jgi:hypothetical protein